MGGDPGSSFVIVLVGVGALAVAYAWYAYYRVESRVGTTPWLWAARSLAFITILALLLDVRVGGRASVGDERMVLLDASPSMFVDEVGGGIPWDTAEARSRELESMGWRVTHFGGEVDATQLGGAGTRLAPALRRAVELGAREVTVLSDMRFIDPVATRGELATLNAKVEFESFSAPFVNVGVSSIEVADAPVPGSPVSVAVEVHGLGSDSVAVEVTAEGGGTASRTVALPGPGLRRRVALEVEAPAEGGRALYTARVEPAGLPDASARSVADAFPADDRLEADAVVGYRSGAIVLVSMAADWEPRHLLNALAEATGLPVVGYLRVGPDRFAPMGVAAERPPPVDSAAVSRAIADAALVVAHNFRDGDGAAAHAVLGGSAPLIAFPASPAASALSGLDAGAPQGGEWYSVSVPPASPVAPELADALPPGLPPLTGLLVASAPPVPRAMSALEVSRPASTESVTAIHLVERDGRPVVVVAASGFWRWAMRGGPSGEAYRRLWSALSGWLLHDDGETDQPPGPVERSPPSLELLPAPAAADWGSDRPSEPESGGGIPLRTLAWPYLLVISLLCAEWYGRRRGGLR